VLADAREQVTALNGAIRDRLVAASHVDDSQAVVTDAGERLGVGDRVATRLNDRDLGVANRQTWTITAIGPDGALELAAPGGQIRSVPAAYVREHVELAYAVTVYGAQGQTTTTADFVLADHTSAAAAYVAMTRGRASNTAHLVADSIADARQAWELVFGRDRADLGPAHARQLALDDIDRYGTQPHPPPHPQKSPLSVPPPPAGRRFEDVLADLQAAWAEQADLADRHRQLTDARECLDQVVAIRGHYDPLLTQLRQKQEAAHDRWVDAHTQAETLKEAIARERAELREDLTSRWQANLPPLREAAATIRAGTGVLGQRHHQVRDARDTLTTWAEQWRTILPDLPHDADQLAHAVNLGRLWLTNPAVREAFDAKIDEQICRAHPDAAQIRGHAAVAEQQAVRAENDRCALDEHVSRQLRPFGRYGLIQHPDVLLAQTRQDLLRVQDQQRALADRIDDMTAEPALRSLPAGDLDTLHNNWQTRRVHERQAQARERTQATHRAELADRARRVRAAGLDPQRPSPGRDIGGIGR
jgi:hypothetical protein